MKIGIVCLNLSWQAGGPRLVFSVAQAAKKAGHTVIIYTPEFTGQYFKELWEGLDIRVVPPPKPLRWSGLPKGLVARVFRKIEEERRQTAVMKAIAAAMDPDLDVLNIHDFSYPIARFYRKRNPKVKVLWTDNDPPFSYLPKDGFLLDLAARAYQVMKEKKEKKFWKEIDAVSVLDLYNKAWCEKRGMHPVIVRLGVDSKKFHGPVKDFTARATEKKIRLFSLGSLVPGRRYEDIIGAVKLLRSEGYDATAHIISNDMWQSPYRAFLEETAQATGVADKIEFNFKGAPHDELMRAYADADVFVYPMYIGAPRNGFGFSIGVFEAMAAGLPLILCNTTTSTEVLKDGETALFVDPMSPEGIAAKAKLLIEHPGKYKDIGLAGQAMVERDLTWENYTANSLALISPRS